MAGKDADAAKPADSGSPTPAVPRPDAVKPGTLPNFGAGVPSSRLAPPPKPKSEPDIQLPAEEVEAPRESKPSSSAVVMTPMRVIDVTGGPKGPPPPSNPPVGIVPSQPPAPPSAEVMTQPAAFEPPAPQPPASVEVAAQAEPAKYEDSEPAVDVVVTDPPQDTHYAQADAVAPAFPPPAPASPPPAPASPPPAPASPASAPARVLKRPSSRPPKARLSDRPPNSDAPTPPETPALRRELLKEQLKYETLQEPEPPETEPSPEIPIVEEVPGPPPTPTAVDLDGPPPSDEHLETIDEEELTEVTPQDTPAIEAPPRRKRRSLPPRPPPKTSFSDGDGRKRQWWEEMFGEDFERTNYELDPEEAKREVDFIEDSLGLAKGGAILDVACGEGLHAVALSKRGYKTVGIDLSTAQLVRARDLAIRENEKVDFITQDMREIEYDQAFDGVLLWNSSFGYFEEEKNKHVLKRIFKALKPGGSFLLDIPNRDFIVEQQPSQNWFEGDGCVCMDDMHLDFITSRLCVKRTVMLDDGRNREWFYSMRVYGLHELGRMLHKIGFAVSQVSGNVTTPGVFFGSKAPRIIALVHKP